MPELLGRNPHPVSPRMRVRAEQFLDLSKLPDPPDEFDFTGPAQNSLRRMYVNDQLGCCVVSLGYHFLGVASAGAGNEVVVNDSDIVHDYGKIGGYVPGRPSTDRGCNEQDALHYWQTTGFTNGDKLEGWLTVNPADLVLCRKLCFLFEGLYYGYGLPNSWLNTPDGAVWDAARSNPNNGHAFGSFGWKSGKWTVSTWGGFRYMTDAAHKNMDEAYVLLNDTMVNKVTAKAPNAFQWADLVTYWNEAGGKLPEPPRPMPTPWGDL